MTIAFQSGNMLVSDGISLNDCCCGENRKPVYCHVLDSGDELCGFPDNAGNYPKESSNPSSWYAPIRATSMCLRVLVYGPVTYGGDAGEGQPEFANLYGMQNLMAARYIMRVAKKCRNIDGFTSQLDLLYGRPVVWFDHSGICADFNPVTNFKDDIDQSDCMHSAFEIWQSRVRQFFWDDNDYPPSTPITVCVVANVYDWYTTGPYGPGNPPYLAKWINLGMAKVRWRVHAFVDTDYESPDYRYVMPVVDDRCIYTPFS